ncbi:hypothetical protein [Rhizobium leguminosarum]|uniref:hypothetical protein n=1 Tax=Rhizobium leguminosarum TaxID=384 RepID=UPI00144112A9|nr:hypothetical protein [Rhizobium leguminosarum]NKL06974.1 hypothetical protein [Rhizobium leguminosarum bv. viciae]NKL86851.1 hypothetical protein [Rhizobium leguminosarum bv. viciae]NKL91393.1 hypothetical protein [Rhizobium leguminosarum bv. viciae]NKM91716.1 hypothetical protein [Rhizobium leguminosarum bv. viciae]
MDAPAIEAGLIRHIRDEWMTGEGEAFPDAKSLHKLGNLIGCRSVSQLVPLIILSTDWVERLATGFRACFPKPDLLPLSNLLPVKWRLFNTT